MSLTLQTRRLGQTEYEATWRAMQDYTAHRSSSSADELWLTEHAPVYTLGLNRKDAIAPSCVDIPMLMVDRGGKITYHGPGQAIAYLLIDLRRRGWNIRQLVSAMENAVIALLGDHSIMAHARADAPGVYVKEAKIASLGLRLKNGCCYHGLALNVDMDLTPFAAIDPCGYKGMQVTDMRALGVEMPVPEVHAALARHLTHQLNT